MNPFSYNNDSTKLNMHLINRSKHWSRYRFDFPSGRPTQYQEHNTVQGEYYRPVGEGKLPLAVIVHGMGDRSTFPCRMIARDLARRGIASFILYLVFHSSRMPKIIKKKMPFLSPEEWFQGYQTSVIDIRQILDYAGRLQEIDSNKIAVIGISLGGFVSAIAMGVDSRINAGIIMLAGGNYESAAWRKLMRIKFKEEELQEEQKRYRQYLIELAEKGLQESEPPKLSYLTDPVTFAPNLRGQPVMLINALWDERIPRQTTIDMWEAFGRPAIKWFPGTHSTVWALYPLLRREITGFLSSALNL
jgi:dipeptidyl aminopeptidase/acylaminoacyl peptidase